MTTNDKEALQYIPEYEGRSRRESDYHRRDSAVNRRMSSVGLSFDQSSRRLSGSSSAWSDMKVPTLPVDFAGRVLKLEMQFEKGPSYINMEDINKLMDLYTSAVEYYNSSLQEDRQKYYEGKL